MPYTLEQWNKRINGRTDLSTYVTHLTRGANGEHTGKILYKILREQNLLQANLVLPDLL